MIYMIVYILAAKITCKLLARLLILWNLVESSSEYLRLDTSVPSP